MTKHLNLQLLILIIFIVIFQPKINFAQKSKIGDIHDGNRSPHVHVLDLRDEEGSLISPNDNIPMPFSTKQTCIECHDYNKISDGWHFNAVNPEITPGRRGEPWILIDPVSGTQVPLSHRNWRGLFKPEDFGLTPFFFTEQFGSHLTGGGVSENDSTESSDTYLRWMVSGKAEINCLVCHDAESIHDQAEYDSQIKKQNYRWAAAATSSFAEVFGSAKAMPDNYDIYSGAIPDIKDAVPPSVVYDKNRFNSKEKVTFDIVREAPDKRCNFCHSSVPISEDKVNALELDQDVHLAAGMTCVDCHRNGVDHLMTRGYEWEAESTNNPSAASLSCSGCHTKDEDSFSPKSGRFGAVYPAHKGLPTIHFDKLTCTACHSGSWPTDNTQRVKLSRTHSLGTHGVKRIDYAVPDILSPVYVKDDDGKIAPHRLIFPAYWAYMDGDSIKPVAPEEIRQIALFFILADTVTDSTNVAKIIEGSWPNFSKIQLTNILDSLETLKPGNSTPVYIGGGKVFSLVDSNLIEEDHPAAEPYSWAFAHDVRPAGQALGVRGCNDCHSLDSPFIFGKISASLPFDFTEGTISSMASFEGLDYIYPRVFTISFLFRPLLKYTIIVCCIIIFMVLILYSFKGLEYIIKSIDRHKI